MKTKLYRKYVKFCLNCVFKKKIVTRENLFGKKDKFSSFIAHPLKYDKNGQKMIDNDSFMVISHTNFLSSVWNDFLVKDMFRKKYKRYSRKYWTGENVLKRAVEGVND